MIKYLCDEMWKGIADLGWLTLLRLPYATWGMGEHLGHASA